MLLACQGSGDTLVASEGLYHGLRVVSHTGSWNVCKRCLEAVEGHNLEKAHEAGFYGGSRQGN